jgi:hypothetical protein
MKVLVLVSALGACGAFAPRTFPIATRRSLLRSSPDDTSDEAAAAPAVEPTSFATDISATTTTVPALYGWVPDDALPCYGLPGALAPTGYFDPLGFCQAGISLNDVKRYREAEVQHGRVAMRTFVCLFRYRGNHAGARWSSRRKKLHHDTHPALFDSSTSPLPYSTYSGHGGIFGGRSH